MRQQLAIHVFKCQLSLLDSTPENLPTFAN